MNEQNYGTKEYPSFWKTIVESKEWKLWYKEQMRRFADDARTEGVFDIDESQECGWMSPGHWEEFVKFIKGRI